MTESRFNDCFILNVHKGCINLEDVAKEFISGNISRTLINCDASS